jgi:hypothetical protein
VVYETTEFAIFSLATQWFNKPLSLSKSPPKNAKPKNTKALPKPCQFFLRSTKALPKPCQFFSTAYQSLAKALPFFFTVYQSLAKALPKPCQSLCWPNLKVTP